jgi:hypothetical protein
VEVSLDDFRRHFGILSDEALLSTNREELVENARECYDAEVARRGLNSPPGDEIPAEETSPEHKTDAGELVLIATYNIPEEASMARGLLQSAEIPWSLENEYAGLGGFQLRLLVPAAFEEQAREVLETEISDEELAAQAEAAGVMEDDSEADESRPL